MRMLRAEIDGHDARADELWYPALVNYRHFTGMQVRNRAVRGLDRHLDRLDTVIYQRPMAHIKHTGTFGQIHYGLMAERNGRRASPAGGYGNHENGLGDLPAHRLAAALTSLYGQQRPVTHTG
jgi:hypothetical protein